MFSSIQAIKAAMFADEHPDLDVGRLRILRYAFKLFGWMAIASTLAAGLSWLFVTDSEFTPLQVLIYALVALFCHFANPTRLIWAFFAALGPLAMAIAAALENSVLFIFVGMFFSVFGMTLFFGALRGMLYLTGLYLALIIAILSDILLHSPAELARLPAYFFASACMVLCLGVVLRSLTDTFHTRDKKEDELQSVNQRLNSALSAEQASVTRLTQVQDELNASVENLRSARYDLEEKTLKQQEIFAIIGHELRAPAAGIATIAEDTEHYPTNQALLSQMSAQLLRVLDDMRQIVQQQLQHPIKIEPVLMSELLHSVTLQMQAPLENNRLTLSTQLGSTPIDLAATSICIDRYRIETMLTNLIRNACVHSAGSKLQVICNVVDRQLVIQVEDDGRGMAHLSEQEMFSPWVRGDSTAPGTGLGLTIVERAATELGGTVSISSSPSGGASIQVCVPLQQSVSTPVAPLDRIALDQLNLVVVDDDETLGFLMKRRFTPLFQSVHLFDNPEVALAEVLDNPPDVLITDNFMPQMSGVELITRLRARGFDRPIIGSTGADLFEGTHPMLEAGANELIIKPMTPENLTQAIERIFQASVDA